MAPLEVVEVNTGEQGPVVVLGAEVAVLRTVQGSLKVQVRQQGLSIYTCIFKGKGIKIPP